MESRLSNRVKSFPPSGIRKIFELAQQPGVISLAVGEPDLDTPLSIRAAAKDSLDRGETHYSVNLGSLELRKAVAERMDRVHGLSVEAKNEVIMTVGGTEALYLAMSSLVNAGDEVLIPDPGFMVYGSQVQLCDATAVPYALRFENDFYPAMAEIEASITPRTRLLLLNSPGNPTGQLFPREVLMEFADLARRHDLMVISDEVYDEITYDGRDSVCFATLPGMRDRTITINSLSKSYAMTGWRLGYAIAHPGIVEAMMKVHQLVAACVPTMLQVGAVAALRGDQSFTAEMRTEYQERRDLITGLLNRVPGFHCLKPEGAFYAFPNVKETGMNSVQLCEFLLQEAKVGCVPGSTFGVQGEGHIRISYATAREKLVEAGERMAKALQRL